MTKETKRFLLRGAIYVVVGVLFAYTEHAWESWYETPCEEQAPSPGAGVLARGFYTYLTTFDRRKPENLKTSVIILRDKPEPANVMDDFCIHRQFVQRLIAEIAQHDPYSIVVDNYISTSACPVDADLDQTFAHVNVPLIIGLHTLKKDDLEDVLGRPLSPEELKTFAQSCQVLYDNRELPASAPHVRRASIRFNSDLRKLPISWPVFSNPTDLQTNTTPITLDTLAAEGARTAQGRAVPDLEAHPFTSFLSKDEIRHRSGIQVLCKEYQAGDDWSQCESPGLAYDDVLRHRVVLIGDDKPTELFHTLAGTMPGVYVHANYIEALADGRFFKPISEGWQLTGGFATLVLIELAYLIPTWIARRRPDSALKKHWVLVPVVGFCLSLMGTVALWIGCILLAVLSGTLAVFWAPGAVALFLRFAEGIREPLMEGS